MKIECKCEECGKVFDREKRDVNSSNKAGRKIFCSLSCSGKQSHKHLSKFGKLNSKYLIPDNRRDEYTGFREYLKRIKRRDKNNNITLKYLKELWDKNHVCSLSGVELKIPNDTKQVIEKKNGYTFTDPIHTGSVDRIDNNKGYIKGNIRYISLMANLAKSWYNDEYVIEFAKLVNNHHSYIDAGSLVAAGTHNP